MKLIDIHISGTTFSCPSYIKSFNPIFNQSTGHDLSEPQPEGFVLELAYKPRPLVLYNIYVLVLLVHAVATLALEDFDGPINIFRFGMYGLEVRFSSTRDPAQQGYQAKTVMWSLRVIACWMHVNDDYFAELGFLSRYEPYPPLGSGQLISVPPRHEDEQSANFSKAVVDAPTASAQKASANEDVEIAVTNMQFAATGASFTPFEIYNGLINMLISEGELDPESFQPSFITYSEQANLSIIIGATSIAAAHNFPNKFVIAAIEDLAKKLSLVREPALKWKECIFRVRNNGRIIGKGAMRQGPMGSDSRRLWENATDVERTEVS